MAASRSVCVNGDFFLPVLTPETVLVDVGCGAGELTLELAEHVKHVVGVDSDPSEVRAAQSGALSAQVSNATFVAGDAYHLDLPDQDADAVFAHSVLEALARPLDALAEIRRVLKSGGALGVASVEYSGLILAGPHDPLIHRFFEIRKELWRVEGANPYLGRHLRRMLADSGYVDIEASTKAISYGTGPEVMAFGRDRAEECHHGWYVSSAPEQGLATGEDLAAMRLAWLEWAESSASYAAFTWCRAPARKP